MKELFYSVLLFVAVMMIGFFISDGIFVPQRIPMNPGIEATGPGPTFQYGYEGAG